MFNEGKCGEPSTLGMEGRDRQGRQGTSDRRDELSNNKMLTEAVDMTIWLAESVDWLSHVRGEWRRRLQEWNGDVVV
jgi:hypothetical protein